MRKVRNYEETHQLCHRIVRKIINIKGNHYGAEIYGRKGNQD